MNVKPSIIHLVALVNRTRATGQIQNVNLLLASVSGLLVPLSSTTSRRRSSSPSQGLSILTFNKSGKQLAEFRAELIADACRAPSDDDTGTIDACIPMDSEVARIELRMSNQVLDTFSAGATVKAVREVKVTRRSSSPAGGRRSVSGLSAEETLDPVIAWENPAPVAPRGVAAGMRPSPKYTVQVSTDDGQSWQTVGFNQPDTNIALDHNLLPGVEKILVRITTTDGLHSSSTEKVFKVADLI